MSSSSTSSNSNSNIPELAPGFLQLPLLSQIEILQRLDDKSFKYTCSLTQRLNDICEDTIPENMKKNYGNLTSDLYQKRSKNLFKPNIIALKSLFNISWKEFYERVNNFFDHFKSMRKDALRDYNYEAEEYLINKQFLEFLVLEKLVNIGFDMRILALIIKSDSLELVKWLFPETDNRSDRSEWKYDIHDALLYVRSKEVLEYLSSLEKFTDAELIQLADDIRNSHEMNFDLLKYLYDRFDILPSDQGIADICSYGYIDVLKLLNKIGKKFNISNLEDVITSDHVSNKQKYETVLYLIETGVEPNLQTMRDAMMHQQIGLVRYFYEKWNLVPTPENIVEVIEGITGGESSNIIIWLFQNGFTLPKTIELPDY